MIVASTTQQTELLDTRSADFAIPNIPPHFASATWQSSWRGQSLFEVQKIKNKSVNKQLSPTQYRD